MNYVNNKQLKNEIVKCLDTKIMSNELTDMVMQICERLSNKYKYTYYVDKEDCISFSFIEVFQYWHKYDPTRSSNAFAFITSIAFKGLNKGFKIVKGKIELINVDFNMFTQL